MTLGPGELGALVALGISYTALVGWAWRTWMVAANARDDLAEHRAAVSARLEKAEARLDKAETTAANLERLADAVKYGAEATSASIANLAERVAEHAAFAKEQFTEIRHEQKAVRAALATRQRAGAK